MVLKPYQKRTAMGVGAALLLLLIAAVIWREDIFKSFLDPKEPYQVYVPPRAPNYANRSDWALLPPTPDHPSAADPPVDVFFIHSTTYNGGRNWNGPLDDRGAVRQLERVILPNYAGPFQRVGRVFAPRYRQASLFAQLSLKDDSREARRFAYGDVDAAFHYYLQHYNGGRSFIVAGVEQGGFLADGLVRFDIEQNPRLLKQLSAVYLINATVLRDGYAGPAAPFPICADPYQSHCVVAWNSAPESKPDRAKAILDRSLVWVSPDRLDNLSGRDALCVNPLLGAASDVKADARLNRGATNATDLEWGARPAFLPHQASAQCVNGVLLIAGARSASFRPPTGWPERVKTPGFNLFYADIEADAMRRIGLALGLPGAGRPAPPITRSVAVRSARVHRID